MAHPYADHRQSKVEKSRVAKIAKGYATGGAVDAQAGQQAMMKGAKPKGAKLGAIIGGKAKARMDKRARGGRVKGKGTNVNIVIAQPNPQQQGMDKPVPVPVPVPAGGPPPGAPPMLPPGAMAGGPGVPPGMPPGMPPIPRKRGGRVARANGGKIQPITINVRDRLERAIRNAGSDEESARIQNVMTKRYGIGRKSGGRVADVTGKVNGLKQSAPKNVSPESPGKKSVGPGWKSSMEAKTKVAGMPGKQPDPPRGNPVTFATGGAAPGVVGKMRGGPKMKYGAESGMGRLERASKQKRA